MRLVGGADTSSAWLDRTGPVHAAVVVLRAADMAPGEAVAVTELPALPYRSGFLGFREAPAVVAAFARLTVRPDLLMLDGQGVAHPRGLGLACQVGVLLDRPTIGVAKTRLIGEPAGPLGGAAGDRVALVHRGEVVGMMLRTRPHAQPLYVSTGHRVSAETAADLVMAAVRRHRLPEPTRLAHDAANEARRRREAEGLPLTP